MTMGASYARQIGQDLVFEGNLRGQVAPGETLPVERLFGTGGVNTVRGYPENVVSGGSGAQLRRQLARATPCRFGASSDFGLIPFAFLDAAFVGPYRTPGAILPRDAELLSAGGVLRMGYRHGLAGVLMSAVALSNTRTFRDKGDPGLHVGLDCTFRRAPWWRRGLQGHPIRMRDI